MTARNIGILGLGVYLPDTLRRNDWWSADTIAGWKRRAEANPENDPSMGPRSGPIYEASKLIADDPFKGSAERYIMDDGMEASDMEILAAKRALADAGVDADDVDLLLVSAWVPDLLGTNAACTVHAGVGLPRACVCLSIDSNYNGFHHQVALAEAMIAAGQAKYGLLVQSCSISRLLSYDQHYSSWFGDAATAVVVGSVADGFGVLGRAHRADGTLQRALLTGVPGARWYEEGRSILFSERPDRQQEVLARVCESSADVIGSALAQATLTVDDVDFYAGHQGTWWYRRVTQANAGLSKARALDTFSTTGHVAAANIPMILSVARERGLVNAGDIVVTHAGGNGSTWSALVLRWGTGRVE